MSLEHFFIFFFHDKNKLRKNKHAIRWYCDGWALLMGVVMGGPY